MSQSENEIMQLEPLDIFTNDIKDVAKDLYNPIFENIRIYGTIEDPVFIAKDVQTCLEMKDLNYKREGYFEWGLEKVKIKIQTKSGMREAIAFTEHGLYKAIWNSRVEMARKFQTFMRLIMKRLRTHGSVTLEEGLSDLKLELQKIKDEKKRLEDQLDDEHYKLKELESDNEYQANKIYDLQYQNNTLERRLENAHEPDIYELEERVKRLEKFYMREIVVSLTEPPKDLEDFYLYKLEDIPDWADDYIDTSDTMLYSISEKPMKSKKPILKIWIHKELKIDDLHTELASHALNQKNKPVHNVYETTLEHILLIKDDLNKKVEAKWKF